MQIVVIDPLILRFQQLGNRHMAEVSMYLACMATDIPRPLYGQKTPKKLVAFNVSFQTAHWTRIILDNISCYRFYLPDYLP